ncbi:hypothetical protein HED60_08975 [Planctomycetales bacterium ZRK34]|nr:hypothetical protein HED60_08975 [Planctomycetales bacterium ZRK34]
MRHKALVLSAAMGVIVACCAVLNIDQAGAAVHDAVLQRVVRQFDFEERKLGNFEPMPMHWFRVQGAGYPKYTEIGFDRTVSASADTSLKLQLNGGSAAVVLEAGTLPAIPQANYLITAKVRTDKLRTSRARITAVFINQHSKVLAATQRATAPIRTDGQWSQVSIQLPDAPDQAAWIILRLELLQADQFEVPAFGLASPRAADHIESSQPGVLEQDIHAVAWFDDVTIFQLPLINLHVDTASESGPTTKNAPATDSIGEDLNVIRLPDRPALHAHVHDVTGSVLTARLSLYDADGRQVGQQVRPLDDRHPGRWVWQPDLPALGHYRAVLHVMYEQTVVAITEIPFTWLPPATVRSYSESDRFVIAAEHLPLDQRPLVPALMRRIGPQRVLLSLWRADMTHAQLMRAIDEPDPLVTQLLKQDQHVMLSFAELPRELAMSSQTDIDRPLKMFADPAAEWKPYVQAVLARYGHQIIDWQFGPTGGAEGFTRADLGAVYQRVADHFKRFVPSASFILPWRATFEMTDDATSLAADSSDAGQIMMHLPVSIRPDHIEDYAKAWSVPPSRMIYHFATLDPDEFSARDRATDLALRMIHTWKLQPAALAIDQPWSRLAPRDPAIAPDALLGVWTTVAEQLAGRRYVGEMDLGEGIRCILLDSAAGGAIVAWNQSSPNASADLDLYLGSDPSAVDIHGNRFPLSRHGDKQRLRLTQQPVFIEGVDMRLARFRAGFRIEPDLTESVHTIHEHVVHVENPWPSTITGHLRLTGPERWDFIPRSVDFSIPAGQTYKVPVDLTFPLYETAGEKLITARVDLDADQRHTLDLATPIKVGLPDIDLKSSITLKTAPDGTRLAMITLVITNLSDRDESFYAFALPPGMPRQQRIVSPLKSGQTLVKHFTFPADQLTGRSIRVGLRQTDGPAVLNHVLEVP